MRLSASAGPGWSIGNLSVLFILGLILVVALFLIPEVIGFRAKFDKPKETSRPMELFVKETKTGGSGSDSEIDNIEKKVSSASVSGSAMARLKVLAPSSPEVAVSPKVEPAPVSATPVANISLTDPSNRRALKAASEKANKLITDLDGKYVRTRFALINYVNGIGRILGDKSSFSSGDETSQYLASLDAGVTRSMLYERVPRNFYLDWTALASGPGGLLTQGGVVSNESLRAAQGIALSIFKELQGAAPTARFALLNYINGTAHLLDGSGGRLLKSDDTITFLRYLDTAVQQALASDPEGVEYIPRWNKVGVTGALAQSSALAIQHPVIPFHPLVRLTKVHAEVRGSPKSRVYLVQVKGYVTGREIKELQLMRGGDILKKLSLGRPDDRERRTFNFDLKPADGLIRVRAVDKIGEVYDSLFEFQSKLSASEIIPRSNVVAFPPLRTSQELTSYFILRGGGRATRGGGSGWNFPESSDFVTF